MPIDFVPLQCDHFPLLLKWLQTPHVQKWWDGDVGWTPALVAKKYSSYVKGYKRTLKGDRIVNSTLHAFIIEVNGHPIGYIQYYDLRDFPPENLDMQNFHGKPASLDLYIGETRSFSKGLSTLILKAFLKEHVFKHFDICLVNPDLSNTSAIAAYKKVGFIESFEGALTLSDQTP